MRQFDCPQCSAPIPFETPGAVFAICPSCRSMVVRKDIGLEAIGTMAQLPPDQSPLQIGARGVYRDKRFKLVGRLKVQWDDGRWNEWYADFGNGKNGWVAETQGFFMISEPTEIRPEEGAEIASAPAGGQVRVGGHIYRVADIKEATAVAGEGELPFVAKPGERWKGVDLIGAGNAFAGLEWHGAEPELFVGSTAQPEEIQWEGLRAVPGWNGEPVPIEKNNTQALNCPNCGGLVQVKHAGVTSTLSCSHCGSLIDVDRPVAALAQKEIDLSQSQPPPLPLGKRGTLRGVEWEVMGSLVRQDPNVAWFEILLYNPWHGFSWLTMYQNHWNFVKRVPDEPVGDGPNQTMGGVSYRLFDSQTAQVTQVSGEFYWRVRVGEQTVVSDYVAPPRILSSEMYPELQEQTWSAGEYIESKEVAFAFGTTLRQGEGVFLNAPNPWRERRSAFVKMGLVALVGAMLLEMLSSAVFARRVILSQDVTVQPLGPESPPIVTNTFDLRGSRIPEVNLDTSTTNVLINLSSSLVREKDGFVFPAMVMGDNPTSPDSLHGRSSFPALPAGKYHFTLKPMAGTTTATGTVHVTIQQGGLFTSNFVLCLLAMLSWPAFAIYRYGRFEADRWSQSDYTP